MNKKKYFFYFLFGLFILIGICWYFIETDPMQLSIKKVAPDSKIGAVQLTNSFLHNESTSNSLYKGKIVEVTGIVKEVTFLNKRNTVILQGGNTQSGVLCDMHSTDSVTLKNIKKGDSIKIKGVCKGFLKDVIILNCILINQ